MKRIYILSLLFLIASNSYAQTAKIETVNGKTREVREYSVSKNSFDIKLSDLNGWDKCHVMPLREFMFLGNKRMRVDMFCLTSQKQSTMFSCTTGEKNTEVSFNQITATNTTFNNKYEVNSSNYYEISVTCSYF